MQSQQPHLFEQDLFPTSMSAIEQRVASIHPGAYARTRNFLDGDVTWLSPYITHGVINTSYLAKRVLADQPWETCEKFIFELAWREFFHHVWLHQGDAIFQDMEQHQSDAHSSLPDVLMTGHTGLEVIDDVLTHLFKTGAMHNHARMWVASLASCFANTSWKTGSQWLYYHLMDGDLASNTLSWQWVAGTFSNKPYRFNQDNINKYSRRVQQGTWLDVSYEDIQHVKPPSSWQTRSLWSPKPIDWPKDVNQQTDFETDICLHHPWNLDPAWRKQDKQSVHVLLFEPSILERFPMSPRRIKWLCTLAKALIPDIVICVEDFETFQYRCKGTVFYKTYPLVNHWQGQAEPREWMFDLKQKQCKRFFAFWNHHKKRTFGA